MSRGRSLSRATGDRNFSPNGRKRKLSSQNSSGQASKSQASTSRTNSKKERQSVLDFSPSTKRIRISSANSADTINSDQPGPSGVSKCIPRIEQSSSDSEEDDAVYLNGDMAQQSTTGFNQTISTNNFKAHKAGGTVGLNNHAKKSGGGKKLVIKNRKSKLFCVSLHSSIAHCCSVFCSVVCCLLPGNQTSISSCLRVVVSGGGGGGGVKQWIWMAADYIIVILPDTGALDHASSVPSVWEYNYYMHAE